MTTIRALNSYSAPTTLASLPINPDDGFPQSFRFGLGERTYRAAFYVAIAEQRMPPPGTDPRTRVDVVGGGSLATVRGLLVGLIIREGGVGDTTLLRRRLLPGLAYLLADLILVVDDAAIAVGNLNGVGAFDSTVAIRVGAT